MRPGKVDRRRKEQHIHCSQKSQHCAVALLSSTATRELVLSNAHHIMHKAQIHILSSVFHSFISHMSEFVLYVFGILEIQQNRFQCVVMHVSIVKERRNIVRWKSTPASRRNKREQSQVTIFLQI